MGMLADFVGANNLPDVPVGRAGWPLSGVGGIRRIGDEIVLREVA